MVAENNCLTEMVLLKSPNICPYQIDKYPIKAQASLCILHVHNMDDDEGSDYNKDL